MNVTIIFPSSSSFLTVFPSDATRPVTASLNWVANQAPTPNAVTAALSADGKVSFYNLSGTVNVTVDIVGYYQPSAGSGIGPTGPPGPPGPAGVTPQDVIWVAKSGGQFTSADVPHFWWGLSSPTCQCASSCVVVPV
jgi:hypothetical protein